MIFHFHKLNKGIFFDFEKLSKSDFLANSWNHFPLLDEDSKAQKAESSLKIWQSVSFARVG